MRSLYRRLTMTHTLVALLAVLLVGLLASGLIVRAYVQISSEQTLSQSRMLARRMSGPLAQYYTTHHDWRGIEAQLEARMAELDASDGRVVLADPKGRVIFDSDGELDGHMMLPRMHMAAVPVLADNREVGSIAVLPNAEQANLAQRTFVRSLIWIVGGGSLLAIIGALLVAILVARRLVRPLRSLTNAAHRLATGARHETLTLPAEAELAELAHAFNGMANELARQEDLRRQMVADIAHELRTPLSVMQLQVESIEDGIVPPSTEAVAALGGQITLLARLVDDLRLISLADAGQLSFALQPLDAAQALANAAAAAEPRARQGGVELRLEPAPPLPAVRADPQRLAQILGNLIENAIRYTPAGGRVTLRVAREAAMICFSISDTGPGIAESEHHLIFDRFYRTDRARTRETGGSGLGLAIVQRLVVAQGGSVRLHSQPGQGATFSVELPT
ncbi:histidine kinase [Oscillochloris trichoides DG-6]|uniref:histidine kinase n=1 Tax=Oscillochloris trichoides DG-6 TaxID=765420 RepID=E1IB33_9CHLR|nr:ATP-binding protein [Oscillochloris trichoides]EFO81604.1 histidine kinase [Oscillochloris trichoides DG-6]